MIKIIGLSRIHITLIDLTGDLGRIDGGVGVALKEPKIVVRTGDCERPKISLNLKDIVIPKICIDEDYREHVGLGHTTQYLLSIAKLITAYNSLNMNAVELAKLVKRGGTSSVGVYAFAYGGFIVEGGHSKKVKSEALPSDFSEAPPSPLILRTHFPWYIYVNVNEKGKRIFGQEELKVFKNAKIEGVDRLGRVILMKLIPAVLEKDISETLEAIDLIQGLGFKKIEVELQTDEVKELMKRIKSKGYPTGLSSFGPAIYTFVETRREGEELVSYFGGWVTEPNNEGAKVIWS